MSSEEKELITLKVKLLFQRLKEGKVKLLSANMPDATKALQAVQFDTAGEPIYDTISAPVRSMANVVFSMAAQNLDQEREEREQKSPVHDLLEKPVEVSDAILQRCRDEGRFDVLAFDLYRETTILLTVASHASTTEDGMLTRNQALCAGLLVRIVKFMTSVLQLSSSTDRAEIVMALSRSIHESEINLRFLLLKNEERFFDQFVHFSLSPEREMFDIIQKSIAARGGRSIPIEDRMLQSIARVCKASGVDIKQVDPKFRDWGGGVRNRLNALGEGDFYVVQRFGSHAVHGTWVDLLIHNLRETDQGFKLRSEYSVVDERLMLPLCTKLLQAAEQYVEFFFPGIPEIKPLLNRIHDLSERIERVDRAAEDWKSSKFE